MNTDEHVRRGSLRVKWVDYGAGYFEVVLFLHRVSGMLWQILSSYSDFNIITLTERDSSFSDETDEIVR
jgi:hypothetical protein